MKLEWILVANYPAISLNYLCVSLSSDGTIMTIGNHLNDENSSDLGHLSMYEFYSTKWKQSRADINNKSSDN